MCYSSESNEKGSFQTASKIVGKLKLGTPVIALGQKNGWLQISYNQKTAWIHGDYVRTKRAHKAPPKKEPATSIKQDSLEYYLISLDKVCLESSPKGISNMIEAMRQELAREGVKESRLNLAKNLHLIALSGSRLSKAQVKCSELIAAYSLLRIEGFSALDATSGIIDMQKGLHSLTK